ncbi:MAG: Fic family protein [Chthoniobacterales bacterium]|nr:Fic family protein [Chthoniobacterales bacterium]
MKRGIQGQYLPISTVGEKARAFVPKPLPPVPSLVWSSELETQFAAASSALGRLDGIATILPETSVFLYSYVRKEAVLSSQIEGTQSSLSDLLLFENDEAPGVPINDVQEVSNYVAALEHGMNRLREGFPISLRLIRELHEILLSKGRGSRKQPGEFRTSQNWIGGTRPGNARFVPPPAEEVMPCLDRLEKFLHDEAITTLLKAGMAHVQFETIHPFLDGNGRVGRLLITLLLCADGMLRQPLLYLSLFFKRHRDLYYDLLNQIREKGDWEAWLAFFFEGVAVTGNQAFQTATRLLEVFKEDRERISGIGRAAPSALEVHRFFQAHPVSSVREAHKSLPISIPTLHASARQLVKLGILRELPSRGKTHVFAYDRYMEILNAEEAV